MVAITIGLIIMAAVSTLFVSTKQSYNTQDSLARLQENGRLAMSLLVKDIRLAGHFGCIDGVDPGPQANPDGTYQSGNTHYVVASGLTFDTNVYIRIEGIENASTNWLPSGSAPPAGIKPGTDALTLRMANIAAGANVAPGMLNGASPLVVNDTSSFTTGDIAVVSDCITADVIMITGVTGAPANTLQRATSASENITSTLSKAYAPPAQVIKLASRQYFISVKPNGVPALFRKDTTDPSPVELIEGIEDMQILYGEDTDPTPDGIPNIYRKASAVVNWSRVMSIRIGILARTIDAKNPDVDNENYDVDGDGTPELSAPGDRFRRRVFQAVVKLRNV